jgi:aminoglycoside phosphotransferase (APT) family kinase protein
MIAPLADLTAPLRRYFTERLGADDEVTLVGPQRIAIGNSRAMLGVRVTYRPEGADEAREREFVLRVEQGGVFGTESAQEVRLMRALHAAGQPVAPVRFYEPDASVLGAPFFVMDKVAGRGERPGVGSIRECVRLLDAQHQLDWKSAGLGFLPLPGAGRQTAILEIDRWDRIHREARLLPVPLLEEGAAWLRENAPETERIALVHGDPGPGNYMFEGDRITAITDWEFAHLGDPHEDWVYMATMRGPEIMDLDAWRALFEAEVGVRIPDDRWRYWDAFNQFKGACANLTALRLFVDGIHPVPNMLAIGTSLHLVFVRRLAEIVASG